MPLRAGGCECRRGAGLQGCRRSPARRGKGAGGRGESARGRVLCATTSDATSTLPRGLNARATRTQEHPNAREHSKPAARGAGHRRLRNHDVTAETRRPDRPRRRCRRCRSRRAPARAHSGCRLATGMLGYLRTYLHWFVRVHAGAHRRGDQGRRLRGAPLGHGHGFSSSSPWPRSARRLGRCAPTRCLDAYFTSSVCAIVVGCTRQTSL
jgi:hypothetical protein